jgi:DUF2075 family protein/DNA replication protein DnaC
MSVSNHFSIEVSEEYEFTKDGYSKLLRNNRWVRGQMPVVYFIRDSKGKGKKYAYVGETTNAENRLKNHLENRTRTDVLTGVSVIGSEGFNKSVTLDFESKLIQYLTADETYVLQNKNAGLVNHKFYQQQEYNELFKQLWRELRRKLLVSKDLSDLENSELFKYSPYKALNKDQRASLGEILDALSTGTNTPIFVKGSAGTGKTILATYLVKLLLTDFTDDDLSELSEQGILEAQMVRKVREQSNQKDFKVALVVAMSSLRKTLKKVFASVPGLDASMVISPSDSFNLKREDGSSKYDLLIVDEAHRLRKYRNISWLGAFKKNNEKLGLGTEGTELDWIVNNSKHQILFYDKAQSVRPSDVDFGRFDALLNESKHIFELKSQMRIGNGKGGDDYIQFIAELLSDSPPSSSFDSSQYKLEFFDRFSDAFARFKDLSKEHDLVRMLAGYAWEWKSDSRSDNPASFDFELDGINLRWNSVIEGWVSLGEIEKENKVAIAKLKIKNQAIPLREEVGCIHTIQGYDLNYALVIFGPEISYDDTTKKIVFNKKEYKDKYGYVGVEDEEQLRLYIINIYKTLMFRGIHGTLVYVCDEKLRKYFKGYI